MDTRFNKAVYAAGVSGITVSVVMLIHANIKVMLEPLLIFVMFGAGIIYGPATAYYLFTSFWKRFFWVVVSGCSYVSGVLLAVNTSSGEMLPNSGPVNYLYGGVLGAVILASGYAILSRHVSYGWLTCAVVAGGATAFFVTSTEAIFGDYTVLMLWPVWQVVVTICLVKSER
jgi:hypothetical protein